MASSYPTGLDSFAITRADATTMATTHKDDHNNANDALNKVEAELGINPSGASATVAARLDALGGAVSEFTLASSTSVGATTIVLDRVPTAPLTTQQYLVVDAYTSQAEIRKINSTPSTPSVTLTVALGYAHSSGDRVFVVTGPSLSTAVWGCIADGSTDEHTKLQEALIQTSVYGGGLWLDGFNRSHAVSQMLMFPPSAKVRHMQIKATAGFAPVETTNAVCMTMQGNIRTFTAAAATDIFTTPTAHGIPADDIGVVFQGTGLPTGITAGKLYYARDRTSLTFKVAATEGGAAVNLTADGTGVAYCEAGSLTKSYWDDVYITGSIVASINGAIADLQQPGYWNKVRIDFCPGSALILSGQQHVFTNFESYTCGKALVLKGASFMYFYGFNAEGCDRGIYVEADAQTTSSNAFFGLHFEMNDGSGHSVATSIAVDIDNGCQNLLLEGGSVSMQSSGQTFLKCDTGDPNSSSYYLKAIRWSGGLGSTGQFMVNDVDRGISLDQWDDCRALLASLDAPYMPNSYLYTDPNPHIVIGPGGRRISWGSTIDSQPSHHVRPGTTQAGDQYRGETTAGVRMSGIAKDGYLFTEANAAPADGDLVAGELKLWLDDTNGACKVKFKAKQADGTVRNGEVALI